MAWYSKFLGKFRKNSNHPGARAIAETEHRPRISTQAVNSSMGMYMYDATVNMAVNMVAADACKSRLRVVVDTEDGIAESTNHPLVDLIMHPNSIHTGLWLLFNTFASYDVLGNAFWFLRGDASGQPKEIWFLPAQNIEIVPDPETLLKGYVYRESGREFFIHHFEMVHFISPSLGNYWFGRGRYDAAVLDARSMYAMRKYNLNFMENGAMPAGMWAVPQSMDDETYEELKEIILDRFVREKAQTAVVRGIDDQGNRIDYVDSGLDHDEMKFQEGLAFNRQTLLEKGGVPTGMLSEASTEAHANVSERRYWDGIHTRHWFVADTLTNDLLPFFGGGHRVEFDDVRTRNAQQLLFRRQAMDGVASPNEMRRELFGWAPLPDNQQLETQESSENDD